MAGFACSQLVPSSPAEGAQHDHCSNPGGQQQWDGAVLAGTLGCTLGCSPSCWPPALTFLLALLEVGGRRPAREDAGEPGSSPHSTGGAASPFIQCLPSSGTLGSPPQQSPTASQFFLLIPGRRISGHAPLSSKKPIPCSCWAVLL